MVHHRRRDVELLGDELAETGGDTVTTLDLACLEGDRVVGVDREPRVNLGRVRQVAGRVDDRGLRGLARDTGDREADDQCAAALEERLARELLLMHETGHN